MGGSDQWGNIVAGADLVRKLRGAKTHGLVMPLVTTASGVKFGKTEAGAVWLDAERTSPFKFYQFWLNTADADVVRYLKFFTFLGREEIEALAGQVETAPEKRDAQRTLAREVTRTLHGQEAVERVEKASAVLFSEEIAQLSAADVMAVFEDVPSTDMPASAFDGTGAALAELLATSGLASSKGEAARLIKGGGIYVNNRRVANDRERLVRAHAIDGQVVVLRKGRQQQHVIRIVDR
jgi:tyrosyl-tRNA synthetase